MAVGESRVTDHRSEIVTAAGAGTTLLALAAVFALAHSGTNIMGWYGYYVIPAGAILVGALAASGYAIAGWYTGLKMTRRLVLSIASQLLVSYFVAQYGEYQHWVPDGRMGFWAWFDAVTRAFSFANHDGTPGSPFGAAGYAMRALEIGGYMAGGILVAEALRRKPYCDPCRSYRRHKRIALIPGGFPGDDGADALQQLYAAAAAGDRATAELVIARFGPLSRAKESDKYNARLTVWTVRCPRCAAGYVAATRTEGHGKRAQLFPLPSQPLAGETMRSLFD